MALLLLLGVLNSSTSTPSVTGGKRDGLPENSSHAMSVTIEKKKKSDVLTVRKFDALTSESAHTTNDFSYYQQT